MSTPEPSTYAKLPAGTRVLFGAESDLTADLKLLKDADAVGATGKTAGYVEATRLIDTTKKYITDMPDAEDKELVFLDDPTDVDLQAFLAAADAYETKKLRIEFPNGRWADMVLVLGGWSMQELNKGEPMKVVVSAKQNSIQRGYTAV